MATHEHRRRTGGRQYRRRPRHPSRDHQAGRHHPSARPGGPLVHTGQHYDANLSDALPRDRSADPDVHLGVGGPAGGSRSAMARSALDAYVPPNGAQRAVVVQGDTNAVLAAGLAANASDVPLVHIEAGLRSHDRRMPEEHNRVVADHLADLLCAPTEVNVPTCRRGDRTRPSVGDREHRDRGGHRPPAQPGRPCRRSASGSGSNRTGTSCQPSTAPRTSTCPHTLATILTQLTDIPLPVVLPMHPRTVGRVDATASASSSPTRGRGTHRLPRLPRARRRGGAAGLRLGRGPGRGLGLQAPAHRGATVHRAARGPRHLRRTRPARARHLGDGARLARRPSGTARRARRAAEPVRRRDGFGTIRGRDRRARPW